MKNWVFLKLLIFNFFSNNVLYFCNFFIVTILDVTIFKKSRKKVINPNYSLGFVYHHDLSIAHASLGVSYKWINQRLLSDQCMLDSGHSNVYKS